MERQGAVLQWAMAKMARSQTEATGVTVVGKLGARLVDAAVLNDSM